MVAGIADAWTGDGMGTQRVGAIFWWSHETRPERDTSPRPPPHLAVMTPAGIVCLDCPATRGEPGRYWTVTGTPPKVTATPSLDINPQDPPNDSPHWHGFLTDGVLTP
jgi:hypothetical protein